ncbi:MAG: SUMF1/EgtB/PvdO family nonheme iron enzyme, partial [Candidatus Omnitrophica bacterium]|nr:SUMF1/EgtB/PvdO family nonheme iron enzyme [Candidatus Omnitrophota bacterium]
MKRVTPFGGRLALAMLGILTLAASASAGVVFDNSANFLADYCFAPDEFGDQIQLGGDPSERVLTRFEFQYHLSFNASGDEKAELRFYRNDGPGGAPGTMFYDSGLFAITPGDNTVTAQDLDLPVPDTFTWTVRFNGIEGMENAGLPFYNPPTVGSSPGTYWEKTGGLHWIASDLSASGGPPANFEARAFAIAGSPPPMPALSLVRTNGLLILNYSLQSTQGWMQIFRTDQLQNLSSSEQPVYSGPVPPSGSGSLVLSNWAESPRFFFRLAEYPTPANPDPSNLVWIPSGTFVMGSPPIEPDRFPDEGPQSQVAISRGFWMGRTEVTQDQFQALMSFNPSQFNGNGLLPVEGVQWQDATNYCARLTAH